MTCRVAPRGLLAALALLLCAGLLWLRPASAAGPEMPDLFSPKEAIAYSQSAIGRQLADHRFRDESGREIALSDYGGAPLVVSMVFTACAESCPLLIQYLAEAVEVAQDTLGRDSFAVVTVGFDTETDTPERMRAFASMHGIDLPNWRFLSGDPETVDSLIAELGYLRYSSPRGFDHVAQTSVLDGERVIQAHVYGDNFPVPALVDPLKALMFEQVSPLADFGQLVERIRLFCTFYDPGKGRYAFDYSFFVSMTVGGLVILGLATVLLLAWLRSSKRPPEGLA